MVVSPSPIGISWDLIRISPLQLWQPGPPKIQGQVSKGHGKGSVVTYEITHHWGNNHPTSYDFADQGNQGEAGS